MQPQYPATNLFQSEIGTSLAGALFELMDVSTFSIVMLTREIEDKFCKPNVYVELGYLLNKNKKPRTIILAERGTSFPSDIQDITYIEFERHKPHQSLDEMKRVYEEVLLAMKRARIINKNTYLLLIQHLRER